jgi:hypothetical protein
VRRRRRLQHLESEIARANAERAELRRRLEAFEAIAAAAGAATAVADGARFAPWQLGPMPATPMPPVLAAAARELRSHDAAVRLDVAGADVVAVVGGAGDPRDWWTAIWQFTGPEAVGGRPADSGPADPGPADPGPADPGPDGTGPAGTGSAGTEEPPA